MARRLAPTSRDILCEPYLFAIPPELRDEIYCFVLVEADPIELRPDYSSDLDVRHPSLTERRSIKPYEAPGITRTCHQTRKESQSIYWKNNKFTLRMDPSALNLYIR